MAADPINDPKGYAEEQYRAWLTALEQIQSGQEYTIGGVRNGRTLKRADLPEILKMVDYWRAEYSKAANEGAVRTFFVVPR